MCSVCAFYFDFVCYNILFLFKNFFCFFVFLFFLFFLFLFLFWHMEQGRRYFSSMKKSCASKTLVFEYKISLFYFSFFQQSGKVSLSSSSSEVSSLASSTEIGFSEEPSRDNSKFNSVLLLLFSPVVV